MWCIILILVIGAVGGNEEGHPERYCPQLERECNKDNEFEYNGHVYTMPEENQLRTTFPGTKAETLEELVDHHLCTAVKKARLAILGDSRCDNKANTYLVEILPDYNQPSKRLCWGSSGGAQSFNQGNVIELFHYDLDVDAFLVYEGINLRDGLTFHEFNTNGQHDYDFSADELYDYYTKLFHLFRTHNSVQMKQVDWDDTTKTVSMNCGTGQTGYVMHDGRFNTTAGTSSENCLRPVFQIFYSHIEWQSPEPSEHEKPSLNSIRGWCFYDEHAYKEKTIVIVKSKNNQGTANTHNNVIRGCRHGIMNGVPEKSRSSASRQQRLSMVWAAQEHAATMVSGVYLVDLYPEGEFYPGPGGDIHNAQVMQDRFNERYASCTENIYATTVDGWVLRNHGDKMIHHSLMNLTMPGMPKISNCTSVRKKRAVGYCFLQCFGFGPINGGSGVSEKWGKWAEKSIKKLDKDVLSVNRELGALEKATKQNLQLLRTEMEVLYNNSVETRKLISAENAGLAQLQWEIDGVRLQIAINEANIEAIVDALNAALENAIEVVPNYWVKGPDGCYWPPSGSLNPITIPTIGPEPTFKFITVKHSTYETLPTAPPLVDDSGMSTGAIVGAAVAALMLLLIIIVSFALCCRAGFVPGLGPY